MRHGSLFSGIGGFDLAAQWMGWETVAQVEWDKWCQKVLAKNFPNSLRFGDIVEFNKMLQDGKITTDTECQRTFRQSENKEDGRNRKEIFTNGVQTAKGIIPCGNSSIGNDERINIGHIDILTGGFPCQPFSHAGKRKGTDDSRYLWPEMLTTIRILKPTFVVGENVAGLVSMENGKTLDGILSDLANEGYQTEQFIIPACGVGAWHRRDRIWIVAYNNNARDRTSEGRINKNWQKKDEKQQQSQSESNGYNKVTIHYTRNKSLTTNDQWVFPDSISRGQSGQGEYERSINTETVKDREAVKFRTGSSSDIWSIEPSVGRVANGIPNRVDRLKGLGNAIVPQVAYQIFKAIEETNINYDNSSTKHFQTTQ